MANAAKKMVSLENELIVNSRNFMMLEKILNAKIVQNRQIIGFNIIKGISIERPIGKIEDKKILSFAFSGFFNKYLIDFYAKYWFEFIEFKSSKATKRRATKFSSPLRNHTRGS